MQSSSKHIRNSILLTRILILFIALIAIYIIVNSVSIASEFIYSRNISSLSIENQIVLACGIGYIGLAVLLRLLYIINQLLVNISKENVFITANVNLLRHASLCCLAGSALAFLLAAIWSKLFYSIVFAAIFFALIIRIIQNIFQQAIRMKDELDLTI
ncbi:MAG: DUF2975 domain-containing protein [Erysipelotrichaceae bacterium]|nr:DUF2975 domain-containing protein [Erysipelotrichaceae bacterium]MDY6035005.1 DUF2975 domain-containing protein [Bulleidia sp.]